MSTWQNVKLRELCSKIGSGATPHGGAAVYIDAGTSLIRSQNVYNVKFEYEGLAHITADAAKKLDGVTVESGDVLLNITGDSVARTCIVPDNVLPARVNQHVAIIRADPELLDYRYLNYYLASPFMQAHMLGLAVGKGASRNAITKAMIEDFSIPLPPLSVQRRIADILSAYDDLIENNREQIKLLEEAAQRLYKEWFIDLRFPGHEHTPIISGIPEGWKADSLGDLIDFNPTGLRTNNLPKQFIPMEAISTSSMLIDYKNTSSTDKNSGSKFEVGDTLLARITPCLENGKTAFVSKLHYGEYGVGSTEFIVMRPKKLNPYMVYLIARTERFRTYAINSMTGSDGRQRAKVDKLELFPILRPSQKIIDLFSKNAEPIFSEASTLSEKIFSLQEARDRLLPRLMNSTIEVLP